jgi:hypothetical protein
MTRTCIEFSLILKNFSKSGIRDFIGILYSLSFADFAAFIKNVSILFGTSNGDCM